MVNGMVDESGKKLLEGRWMGIGGCLPLPFGSGGHFLLPLGVPSAPF